MNSMSATETEFNVQHCLDQITAMVANQNSNQQIQEELDLNDQAIAVIEHLRDTLRVNPQADTSK